MKNYSPPQYITLYTRGTIYFRFYFLKFNFHAYTWASRRWMLSSIKYLRSRWMAFVLLSIITIDVNMWLSITTKISLNKHQLRKEKYFLSDLHIHKTFSITILGQKRICYVKNVSVQENTIRIFSYSLNIFFLTIKFPIII